MQDFIDLLFDLTILALAAWFIFSAFALVL